MKNACSEDLPSFVPLSNMRKYSHVFTGNQKKIIANLKTIKMVDVVMPTSDGRVVTLPRYVEPKDDVSLLLNQLGFTLPEQPPPKISECLDKR